jgi:putative hydrolase of the HAD superfamily
MRMALLDFKIADEALAQAMNVRFLDQLPMRTILFPYAKEILEWLLSKGYDLHLITNGFELVQHSKLKHSGLSSYFREVITSESSNSLKPNKAIFEFAFKKTNADPSRSIMIGDTIDVDILGAMNAGIDQVFVNHTGLQTDVKPTFTVTSLKELETIF